MTSGAINVVRGSRSSVQELLQLYSHSERLVQMFLRIEIWLVVLINMLMSMIFLLLICGQIIESWVSRSLVYTSKCDQFDEVACFFCMHFASVALAIDNPEMYNRIADTFGSHAAVRFAILLWGEKSSLGREAVQGYPVYTYKEIIELGHKSRVDLFDSEDASKTFTVRDII